jgi:hypothetical protein
MNNKLIKFSNFMMINGEPMAFVISSIIVRILG